MKGIKKESYVIILLVFVLMNIPFSNAIDVYNIKYDFPKLSTNLNISLNFSGQITNPQLYLLGPLDINYKIINYNNGFLIPSTYLTNEGIYSYYISYNNSKRYPLNVTISFSIYNNSNFLTIAKTLLDASNNNYSCNVYTGDFTCGMSNFQTIQILAFSKMYYLTKNDTYLDIAYNLLKSDYVDAISETSYFCDAYSNDYNCASANRDGFGDFTGPSRQAENILWLLESYKLTKNTTFLEYALNYTRGSSDSCNVWTGNFDCNNADDQGLMTLAYLKIYETTNNETYNTIANNLYNNLYKYNTSLKQVIDIILFTQTGNSIYSEDAENQKGIYQNECVTKTCSILKKYFSTTSYKELYLKDKTYTSQSDYEKKFYSDITNNTCNPFENNYTCKDSLKQGLMTYIFLDSYENLKETSPLMFQIIFENETSISTDITITAKGFGRIINPKLYYKKITNPEWNYTNLSLSNYETILNGNNFIEQNIYEFYINFSTNYTYPFGNGTIKKVFNSKDNNLNQKIKLFLDKDTKNFCDVNGQNPSFADYSCRMEDMQSKMIEAYNYANIIYPLEGYKTIIGSLSTSRIDDTNSSIVPLGIYQTCDHTYLDFECDEINQNNVNNPLNKNATYKQAKLISAYSKSYTLFDNITIKKILSLYAFNKTSSCNVWNAEYDCKDDKNQAELIIAYINAFTATGNLEFYKKAENLANQNISRNSSVNLLKAYSKMYELTGNATYYQKIYDLSDNYKNACEDSNCTPERYAATINSLFEAFKQTNEEFIETYAYTKTRIPPKTSDANCDPTLDGDGSAQICNYPGEKADIITSLIAPYENFFPINQNYSVTLTVPPIVDFQKLINATCVIKNIGNFTNTPVYLDLSSNQMQIMSITPQSLPTSTISDHTITISNMTPNQEFEVNLTINATKGGLQTIGCDVYSFRDEKIVEINNLGNIVNMSFINDVGEYVNEENIQKITLKNKYLFDLYNITINLTKDNKINFTNDSNTLNIMNITTSIMDAIIDTNKTIIFPSLLSGENVSFNLTLVTKYENISTLNISVTGAYGVNLTHTLNYTPYLNPFNITIIVNDNSVGNLTIYKFMNISYNIKNNKNISFKNTPLSINRPNNLIYTNTTTNTTLQHNDLNPSYFIVNFTENGEINISEIGYFNNLNYSNITLQINLDNYHLNELLVKSLNLTNNHFNFSLSKEENMLLNNEYLVTLNISSISEFNKKNFTINQTYSNESVILETLINYSSNYTSVNDTILIDELQNNETVTLGWRIKLTKNEKETINLSINNLNNETIKYAINLTPYIPPPASSNNKETTPPPLGGGGIPKEEIQINSTIIIHTYTLEEIRQYVEEYKTSIGLAEDALENISQLTFEILKNNFTITSNITLNNQLITIKKKNSSMTTPFLIHNNILIIENKNNSIKDNEIIKQNSKWNYTILNDTKLTQTFSLEYIFNLTERNITKPIILINLSLIKDDAPIEKIDDSMRETIIDIPPEEIIPFSVKLKTFYTNVSLTIQQGFVNTIDKTQSIAKEVYEFINKVIKEIKRYPLLDLGLIILMIGILFFMSIHIILKLKKEMIFYYMGLKICISKPDISDIDTAKKVIQKVENYKKIKLRYPLNKSFLRNYEILKLITGINNRILQKNKETTKTNNLVEKTRINKEIDYLISEKNKILKIYAEETKTEPKIDIKEKRKITNLFRKVLDMKKENRENYFLLKQGIKNYKKGELNKIEEILGKISLYEKSKVRYPIDQTFTSQKRILQTLHKLKIKILAHEKRLRETQNKNEIVIITQNLEKLKNLENELLIRIN